MNYISSIDHKKKKKKKKNKDVDELYNRFIFDLTASI
jgi:hypothetical protein